MKPNAYKLGQTVWKYHRTQEYTKVRKFTCDKYGYRCLEFTEEQLVELGSVPVTESKQIEKSNIDFKSKTDWQAHLILLEDKINEIIDYLQKG